MLSGLAAFFYVAALWFIAPAFLREDASVADRLRTGAVLGIAVPGALAVLHLLYAPLLWVVLALSLLWRIHSGRRWATAPEAGVYGAFAGALLVIWPPLARPLLDGDTLLYHLPNAAAFVQSHSLWVTRAAYWIYPQGSELFASGIFAASGRWGLPLAGIVPALLLVARLYEVARANGASQLAAAGLGLAFICTPVAAFQSGTLQNDLWLAAFFVEVLCADRSPASLAICALLKPYGWLEGLIAAITARVPWRTIGVALVPLALWAVRDAVLVACGASLGFSAPQYTATSIAGNITAAVPQLAHGIAAVTPQAFVWIAMLAAAIVVPRTRRYAIAGWIAMGVYALLPVSYSDGVSTNFVTDASSLRYALPAIAAAALCCAGLLRSAGIWGAIAAYVLAAWGAWSVLGVFWNDAYAHYAWPAAVVLFCASIMPPKMRAAAFSAGAFAIVLAGSWCASSRAQSFYADWMRQPSGKPTGVFAWIDRRTPARVIASNVRAGAILMSSPRSRVEVAPPDELCERAHLEHATVVVGSNEKLRGEDFAQAVAIPRSCGTTVYEDGAGVVVQAP